jgi:hypothetical protein
MIPIRQPLSKVIAFKEAKMGIFFLQALYLMFCIKVQTPSNFPFSDLLEVLSVIE